MNQWGGRFRNKKKKSCVGPGFMGASEKRADALRSDLLECILAARFAPGASYPVSRVAMLLRATPLELEPAFEAMSALGLIKMSGETLTVTDVDRERLLALMPRRAELEIAFFRKAAANRARLDVAAIEQSVNQMRRCAVVGDLDGYMRGNQQFHEQVKRAVTDDPGLVDELDALRNDFRRAWCAFNRLRELTPAAELRERLARALLSGDEVAVVTTASAFLTHLEETF
jgi:DNA-binding GntR family transcriptional regulator